MQVVVVINPVLAAIVLGAALVVCLPACIYLGHLAVSHTAVMSAAYQEAAGQVSEVLSSVRTVAALGLEPYMIRRYDQALERTEQVAKSRAFQMAFALSTITAFVFYAAGMEAFVAMLTIVPLMVGSEEIFMSVGYRVCVPKACSAQYNPEFFSSVVDDALRGTNYWNNANGTCFDNAEPFRLTCATGEAVFDMLAAIEWGAPFTATYSISSEVSRIINILLETEEFKEWTCAGIDFVEILIAQGSILFAFIVLPAVPPAMSEWLAGISTASRCLEIIDRKPDIDPFSDGGRVLAEVAGHIELNDVTFAYPATPKHLILDRMSVRIPAGTSCAFSGPSGSGKSTVISLIERFYDPQAGTVMLDGMGIAAINLQSLRSKIALVGQEPVLFQVLGRTCIHACTCMHAYTQTHIHTYIHTHTCPLPGLNRRQHSLREA